MTERELTYSWSSEVPANVKLDSGTGRVTLRASRQQGVNEFRALVKDSGGLVSPDPAIVHVMRGYRGLLKQQDLKFEVRKFL